MQVGCMVKEDQNSKYKHTNQQKVVMSDIWQWLWATTHINLNIAVAELTYTL